MELEKFKHEKEGTFCGPNFFDTIGEQIDQKAPLDDYHDDTRSVNNIPDNGQGGHLIREERSPRKFMKQQIRLL